mgnify:CR=1 FL=1
MAKKTKKSNPIHFGIEVTKPHSKEMYAHNDKVAKILKQRPNMSFLSLHIP